MIPIARMASPPGIAWTPSVPYGRAASQAITAMAGGRFLCYDFSTAIPREDRS